MQKWEKLNPGDIVDIVAPASGTAKEVVEAAQKVLRDHGFTPRVPQEILEPVFYHSNSDKKRLEQLKEALLANDSKAIWCLRGGYGSNRLLPGLSRLKKPKKAKVLIGISDLTSIHLFLNQKWKWASLHASLIDRLTDGRLPKDNVAEIFSVLQGEQKTVEFVKLIAMNRAAKKIKMRKAPIVGGNLVTLQSSLGTPWAVQTKGNFLFIEELAERGYRIDRILVHLQQSGKLQGCKGILLGHFIGGDEPKNEAESGVVKNLVVEALQRFSDEQNSIPVWSGIESGHGENLRTLPFGMPASLTQKNGEIILSVETGCR